MGGNPLTALVSVVRGNGRGVVLVSGSRHQGAKPISGKLTSRLMMR